MALSGLNSTPGGKRRPESRQLCLVIGLLRNLENLNCLKRTLNGHDTLEGMAQGALTFRLGILSSWNVPCGIAEYSAYLCRAFPNDRIESIVFSNQGARVLHPDESFVRRPWKNSKETIPDLVRAVVAEGIECLLVQFHSGFFSPAVLAALVDAVTARGVPVSVIFHVIPHLEYDLKALVESLSRASLLVHRQSDSECLASLGLENAEVLPHGICVEPLPTSESAMGRTAGHQPFTVGAFGFLRPHKGFLELMAACHLVRAHVPELKVKILASLYPSEDSAKLLTRCQAYMTYLDNRSYTTFSADYLEASAVPRELQLCDVVVFPYQRTRESSSAAVRMGLASRRPVLCTPLEIFDDVRDAVLFTDGFDAFAIAKGLLDFYRKPAFAREVMRRQEQYLTAHNWNNVAQLLLGKLPVRFGFPTAV